MLGHFYNSFFPLRALRDACSIFFSPGPFLEKIKDGGKTLKDSIEYVVSIVALCGIITIFLSTQHSNAKWYDLLQYTKDDNEFLLLFEPIIQEFCIKPKVNKITDTDQLILMNPFAIQFACEREVISLTKNIFATGSDDISKSIRSTIDSIEASEVFGYLEKNGLLKDPSLVYKVELRFDKYQDWSEIIQYMLFPVFVTVSVFFARIFSPKHLDVCRGKIDILTLYIIGSAVLFSNIVDALIWAIIQSGRTVDFVASGVWTIVYFVILYRPIDHVFGLSFWAQVRMYHLAVGLVAVILQVVLAGAGVYLLMTTLKVA